MSSPTPAQELVRRYFDEIWTQGQIDRAADYLAPDIRVQGPPFRDGVGIGAVTDVVAAFRAAMPDLVAETDILFGDGDRVMQHYQLSGTHDGTPLLGAAASGRRIVTSGLAMYRIAEGRIAAAEGMLDEAGLMQQLYPPTDGR